MARYTRPDDIDPELRRVVQTTTAFQNSKAEANRVAALKAAQCLVASLQTSTESIENLLYSPTHALCVRLAVDLDIFQTITEKKGSTTLQEIADPKDVELALAERIMRILVAIGYVSEVDTRTYAPNDMTRQLTLRTTVAMIKFIFDVSMPLLPKIPGFLLAGGYKNPSGALDGVFQYTEKINVSIWEWLAKQPELFQACNEFMEGNRGSRPSWVTWYPVQERLIDGFNSMDGDVLLVDVAGGYGQDISQFKAAFPNAPGRLVLEDLPMVIDATSNLSEGIDKLALDFFTLQTIIGARVYYLKFILHDWSDAESHQILTRTAEAMKRGYSKLIIEEFILADKEAALLPAMWDWEMMIFCNSMERTTQHWTRLLNAAGFRIVKFWPPPGNGQGIIEAELQ